MCGIARIWYKTGQQNGRATIQKMTNAIAYRGSDREGHATLDESRLFYGYNRLSNSDFSVSGTIVNAYTVIRKEFI